MKSRAGFGGLMRRMTTGALLLVIVASLLVTLPFRWIPPPTSAFILQARLGGLGSQPSCTRVTREWVAWSDIASTVPLAVIASENQLFPSHWGFDLDAIASVVRELSISVSFINGICLEVNGRLDYPIIVILLRPGD